MLCARHLFMGTTLPAARIRCLLSSLEVVVGGFTHKKFTQTLHYCLPLNLDTTNPDGSRVRKLVVICTDLPLFVNFNPKLLSLTQRPSKASVSKRKGKEVLVTRTGFIWSVNYYRPPTGAMRYEKIVVLTDLSNRFINFMLYLKYKHHNSVILVFFSTCFLVLTFQWVECP